MSSLTPHRINREIQSAAVTTDSWLAALSTICTPPNAPVEDRMPVARGTERLQTVEQVVGCCLRDFAAVQESERTGCRM